MKTIEELYPVLPHRHGSLAERLGISLRVSAHYVDVSRENQIIRVSLLHLSYLHDLITSFDYYFKSVVPTIVGERAIADYSTPRFHEVVGFETMPVFFSSFPEPITTTNQYIDFAGLSEGDVVFDLGAYVSLAAINFKRLVGNSGRVIAVEADILNFDASRKNTELFKRVTGLEIELVNAAIWDHCQGIEFSAEGNMGSYAVPLLGRSRAGKKTVSSVTLSELASRLNVITVNFIKCDIEGAESVIFRDEVFFKRYRPKIIIETHPLNGVSTAEKCIADLTRLGYHCKTVAQLGVELPLLECVPVEVG